MTTPYDTQPPLPDEAPTEAHPPDPDVMNVWLPAFLAMSLQATSIAIVEPPLKGWLVLALCLLYVPALRGFWKDMKRDGVIATLTDLPGRLVRILWVALPTVGEIVNTVRQRGVTGAFTALPDKLPSLARRVRVVMRVQIVPQEVGDVTELRNRLFPDQPLSTDHKHTREAFVQVIMQPPLGAVAPDAPEARERQQRLLLMAQTIPALEYHGDDPLGPLRRPKPPKVIASPTVTAQGFVSMPVVAAAAAGAKWQLWAGLAAGALILALGASNVIAHAQRNEARAKLAEQETTARIWRERADNAERLAEANRTAMAELEERQRAEAQKSAALNSDRQRRAARAQAREKDRSNAFTRPEPIDLDNRLRQLAEPSAAAAVPGLPAAPSGGDSAGRVPDGPGSTPAPAPSANDPAGNTNPGE
jgi:hypothetical protein